MSELDLGGEGSPGSTDEAVEQPTEDKPAVVPKPKPKMVEMVNGKKHGRVFGYADVPTGPGETYLVSETKAKKMEKIPRNFRKPDKPKTEEL